jgi:hypothetical protein
LIEPSEKVDVYSLFQGGMIARMRVGFAVARANLDLSDYPPRGLFLSHEDGSVEFNFRELAAFLLTLPLTFSVKEKFTDRSQGTYTHCATLQCSGCGRPNRFRVLCKNGCSTFGIFLVAGCPEMEDFWRHFKIPESRKHFYYLDCQEMLDRVNAARIPDPTWKILRPFARWLLKSGTLDISQVAWFEQAGYCANGLIAKRLREDGMTTLEQFIDGLPGFKKVRLCRGNAATPYQYHGHDIISITWFPAWTLKCVRVSEYFQLDCSFKGAKPFVYCVPQGIFSNEAVPLGFILTPTERQDTYSWIWDDLASILPRDAIPDGKPVLSDMGGGLIAFARDKHVPQYFCYRHIIEKFGSSSLLGILASTVLRYATKDGFMAYFPQLCRELNALVKAGTIASSKRDEFLHFLDPAGDNTFPHGLWHRIPRGISTCSNHAERFHETVNRVVHGNQGLVCRLRHIKDAIVAKHATVYHHPRRQLKSCIAELKQKNAVQVSDCQRPDCMVYRRTMTIRYGLDARAPFPCKHTVNAWDPNNIPPLKDFGVPDEATTPVPPIPPTIQEILDVVWPFAQRFRVRQPGEAPEEVEKDESVTTPNEDDAMKLIIGDQSVSNELIRIAQLVVRVRLGAYRDTKHALVAVCESFAAHPNRPAGQPDLNSPPWQFFLADFAAEWWRKP